MKDFQTPVRPRRVLFVFAWLVVGGEETEVRLLARHLNPARYKLEVVVCFHKPGMPEQTHRQLEELGVSVDCQPYNLSFDDTVAYLASKLPEYDLVVACQAVPDVYPALEHLPADLRPPLIEHGGLVSEALDGPKHLTARYIGVCDSIRQAAASRMPARPRHALEIPSMVDLTEFNPAHRAEVRAEWGICAATNSINSKVFGWVGRLDRKKRVEDFIEAAALLHSRQPHTRFVIIGGPDAFMPQYELELKALAHERGLTSPTLLWLGDCPDVPRLLAGLDGLVWLSRGEGMPHVIAEGGAASLPVVATLDNGTAQQITDGVNGLLVPHENPLAVAAALEKLITDPALAARLGHNLRRKVASEYSAAVVVEHWQEAFDEVINEKANPGQNVKEQQVWP